MKTVTYEEHVVLDDTRLRINTRPNSGCFLQILQACKKQMDVMLEHHSRLFVYRFDLRLDKHTEDNKVMSDFMRAARKMVKSKYGVKNMGFLWGREQQDAPAQHYHAALFLDGNKIHHHAQLEKRLSDIAENSGGSLGFCEHPFYNIHRTDELAYGECFHRLSYIAKERSKGARNSTVNDYSSSRVSPPSKRLVA